MSSADLATQYAASLAESRKRQWDIDTDVIRGRELEPDKKYLPDGISKVHTLTFLNPQQQILLSQIQGRTYAHMFGMAERFIGIKVLDLCRNYALHDQLAMQVLVRFVDEELKHQEMFHRIGQMAGRHMPPGYQFVLPVIDVALAVLGKSTWAVLGLACQLELFAQAHFRASMDGGEQISALYKDVFFYHWRDEEQHAQIDAIEWQREDERLSHAERALAVDDLIHLIGVVDELVQSQAAADAQFFIQVQAEAFSSQQQVDIHTCVLRAYRWQYIIAGVQDMQFCKILGQMLNVEHAAKIAMRLELLQNAGLADLRPVEAS